MSNRPDLLDTDYINSLPTPLFARDYMHSEWTVPICDIDVQTGLVRLDICGKFDIKKIDDIMRIKDGAGRWHWTDDFYTDPERWVDREQSK